MRYRRIAGAVLLGLLLAAPQGLALAQQAGRSAPENQAAPQFAAPPPANKTPADSDRQARPAEAEKREPPKAFEPTEKVKADQAIDFPSDI
jgi:hypothetical protein